MMRQSFSKIMVLVTVIFMDLLTGTEFDLFVPSFPELQSDFALTPTWVEALLSVNFIGYFLSLVLIGGLSDRYGRKLIILIGLLTFIVGSILCVWAPFYSYLLIGRFLQGVGVAAPAILSFLIIADSYPIKEQQFLMAMLNGSLNLAAGMAPVFGSYITLYFNWRGNFIALLMLGVLVLLMTIFFIPYNKFSKQEESISLKGVGGYAEIFHSKPLMLLIVSLLIIIIPYWIFVGMSPLLYIKDLGVTLKHFGVYQGLLAFIFAIGSIIFGLVFKNADYDYKKMLGLTNLILILSILFIGIATLTNSNNPLFITLSILVFVIGQIIPSIILYPLCLNFLPHVKGRVSAMIQGARLILTAISLQVAGYFYTGTFRPIGIIILFFIIFAVVALYIVTQNRQLMEFIKK